MQVEGNDLQQPWLALYTADPILLAYIHSPTLESLDISECGLQQLPESMSAMTALRTLDISNNMLCTLPRALGELRALEAVCMDGNPLAPHLAAMLEKVPNLLHLEPASKTPSDHFHAEGYPAAVKLPARSFWGKAQHELHTENIPPCSPGPARIHKLQIHCSCTLSVLPAGGILTTPCGTWRRNDVQGKAQGPGLGEGAIMSLLSANCPALVLTDLNLSTLPGEVLWHRESLTQLDLTSNALSGLPPSLGSCSLLQELSLDRNCLAEIPDTVWSLHALRVLQLAHNGISHIPNAVTKLRQLALLAVGDNHLTELPTCLSSAAPALIQFLMCTHTPPRTHTHTHMKLLHNWCIYV